MALTCPSCKAETNKLVAFTTPRAYLGCRNCGTPKKNFVDCNLGQVADQWVSKDGKSHRITVGKNWEISHRKLSSEGVVINTKTGKETQF